MATAVTPPDASAYAALSAGCALVDRSELGKLGFVGPQAAAFLDGQVTNDVEALGPGRGCYAALLTNKGKMLGDLRLLRVDEATVASWVGTRGPSCSCASASPCRRSSTCCGARSWAGGSSCASARCRRRA